MTHIDHCYTSEIVCPYCGHNNGSEHEGNTEYEEECGSCEKEYRVSVEYSIDFSTSKFDRKAEDRAAALKKSEHDQRNAERYAECQKWPPGTRMRVTDPKYAAFIRGRVGVVANEELSRHNPFVHVTLDARTQDGEQPLAEYSMAFRPDQIEPE